MEQTEQIALFIDGANLYATAKSLGFDIDYKRLLREFHSRGYLLRAFYYTAVIEDQEYSSIRPLIDWLDYNGYTVVTKATKEFVDQTGRRKVKGNMDIELAVDAMEIAEHIEHMVLFSGDGDFRSLVEAMQRRGVRVTVVSTISTQPPMVADELRRQADIFLDIVELQPKIGRDPAERAAREAASASGTRRNSCSARQRRSGPAPARPSDDFDDFESTIRERPLRQARARLPALPPPEGAARGLARARAGLVQCAGRLLRAGERAAPDRGPGARAQGRQPHRTAVHRRFRRRPPLRYARALRLWQRNYQATPHDGFTLVDARITNAVRCVPPENKPTPAEIKTCRSFLQATIAEMPTTCAPSSRSGGSRTRARLPRSTTAAAPRRFGTADRPTSERCGCS